MKSFCCIYLQKSLKTEFCIKIAYKKVWRICEMCMFLQGNRSDQLELSYYAVSSHLDNQNSRKPVVRAFFTHIDAVITRTKIKKTFHLILTFEQHPSIQRKRKWEGKKRKGAILKRVTDSQRNNVCRICNTSTKLPWNCCDQQHATSLLWKLVRWASTPLMSQSVWSP